MTEPARNTYPNTPFQRQLEKLGACSEARNWVADRSYAKAWQDCTSLDYLRWFCDALILAEYEAKHAPIRAEYEAKRVPILAEYEDCDAFRKAIARPVLKHVRGARK